MSSPLSAFAPLAQKKIAALTTFRKNGTPVATPVWFVESPDGIIYVYTGATSGKIKRIRNSSRVTLAPSTAAGKVTGEAVEARARILDDSQEIARAEALLAKKYGTQRRIFYVVRSVVNAIRRHSSTFIYLAIEI